MKKILDIFKRKEKEEKPYMVMGDNGLPLWVLPLPLLFSSRIWYVGATSMMKMKMKRRRGK